MLKKLFLRIQNMFYTAFRTAIEDATSEKRDDDIKQKTNKSRKNPDTATKNLKDLPEIDSMEKFKDNPPKLAEELIEGVLRVGHKLLISGPSKAGKSFMLMELAVAIAEGKRWLGFQCKKGRVLYINFEIDSASAVNRILEIYQTMEIPMEHTGDLLMWNLRGRSAPLDSLLPEMISRIKELHVDAIIIDPIYKCITGDENNATEMGKFCNLFDQICTALDCAVIYCHHHSKGAQGSKRSADRASGSGVFARDPDAILDIIEISIPNVNVTLEDGTLVDFASTLPEGATCWQLSSTLREFPDFKPLNFFFEYPVHVLDKDGVLDGSEPKGSKEARKVANKEAHKERLDLAFQSCSTSDLVTVASMAQYCDVTEPTIRAWIREFPEEFSYKNGRVLRNEETN